MGSFPARVILGSPPGKGVDDFAQDGVIVVHGVGDSRRPRGIDFALNHALLFQLRQRSRKRLCGSLRESLVKLAETPGAIEQLAQHQQVPPAGQLHLCDHERAGIKCRFDTICNFVSRFLIDSNLMLHALC